MNKKEILEKYKSFEKYSNKYLSNEAIEKVIIDIELKLANNFNKIMDIKNNIESCFATLDKYTEEQDEEALDIADRINTGKIGKKQIPAIAEQYGERVVNAQVVLQKMEEAEQAFRFNKFYEDRLETFYKLRK